MEQFAQPMPKTILSATPIDQLPVSEVTAKLNEELVQNLEVNSTF